MEINRLLQHNNFALMSLIALFASTLSQAVELNVAGTLSAEYTDNALRTDTDTEDDIEQRAELNIEALQDNATLQLNVNYDVAHVDFKNDTVEDETILDGLATATWSPLPNTFSWDALASSTYERRNQLEADTLDNREQRNIFGTGPKPKLEVE